MKTSLLRGIVAITAAMIVLCYTTGAALAKTMSNQQVQAVAAQLRAIPHTTNQIPTPAQAALAKSLLPYFHSGPALAPSAAPALPAGSLTTSSHRRISLLKATQYTTACWFVGGTLMSYTWPWYLGGSGPEYAWYRVDHGYWCGWNGWSIVSNGLGFYPQQWAQWPYCIQSTWTQGWDAPHQSWAHGGIKGSVGVTNPWGCATYSTGAGEVLRINAKGHFDRYNDIYPGG